MWKFGLVKILIDSQETITLSHCSSRFSHRKFYIGVRFISLRTTLDTEKKQVLVSHIASDYKISHTRSQEPVKKHKHTVIVTRRTYSIIRGMQLPRIRAFVLQSFFLSIPKLHRTTSFCLQYSAISRSRNLEYFEEFVSMLEHFSRTEFHRRKISYTECQGNRRSDFDSVFCCSQGRNMVNSKTLSFQESIIHKCYCKSTEWRKMWAFSGKI